MPELPEAETIVRSLMPDLLGRRIHHAEFRSRRVSPDSPALLAGRLINGLRRFGKNILFQLDRGLLLVDLRMTGRLLLNHPPGPYTRAVLQLDRGVLLFDDIRQFGSLRCLESEPHGIGPDPFDIPVHLFLEAIRARRTRVKTLLLDQSFLRGIGNIYADEILFRARVHPNAPSHRLSRPRAQALFQAMRETLEEAIACRGSSVSDYVDGSGAKGSFQLRHYVYRKQGLPCPRCHSPIRRIVVTQRGTHFCPRCQRR
ncbi:MAG: bifunctional DNA-formamidopyrimidine glycosylase/DNA-(apurinic or apyrimidinic site) lyase [Acidimicrobiia bacterium]|nr:bifunctional DNA-formamidopyrimidine glycosylase/DNA-(apurinic or apyrimidinic site) lyase [Acidimicrobiia bacterium]